ncbi:Protein of unknown function [Bacillus mycoides]|nr:Protein of unknown function [Bacillus mycoides]
MDILSPQAQS